MQVVAVESQHPARAVDRMAQAVTLATFRECEEVVTGGLMSETVAAALKRTPLFEVHLELGAKMVPFAGYEMPLQYQGIMAEHLHARAKAVLFDVSHMGQVRIEGDNVDGTGEPGRRRHQGDAGRQGRLYAADQRARRDHR